MPSTPTAELRDATLGATAFAVQDVFGGRVEHVQEVLGLKVCGLLSGDAPRNDM